MIAAKARWTEASIPDQAGRVVVITGANGGLGLATAQALAARGARVVLACRSMERGAQAEAAIVARTPRAAVWVSPLDLAEAGSIRRFAASFRARFDRLDVLINNAGIMGTPYGTTAAGFERQMAVNHLGHFALTGHLLGSLLTTPGSRVVTVTSAGHRAGRLDLGDPLFQERRGYTPFRGYARSKLANLLFAYELARRLSRCGAGCRSVAAHPGAAQTELGRHIEGGALLRLVEPVLQRLVPSAAEGARAQLRAAVDPDAPNGACFGPSAWLEMSGPPVRVRTSRASHRRLDARRLWERSERATGVVYDFEATPSRAGPRATPG